MTRRLGPPNLVELVIGSFSGYHSTPRSRFDVIVLVHRHWIRGVEYECLVNLVVKTHSTYWCYKLLTRLLS